MARDAINNEPSYTCPIDKYQNKYERPLYIHLYIIVMRTGRILLSGSVSGL